VTARARFVGAMHGHAMTPATYSIRDHLRDGRPVLIRALRREDQAGMLAAVDRTSIQSLQRRFFVTKRAFSEKEQDFFMDIDFVNHVALVAQIEENGRSAIVGGGRYVVVQPGQAELALVVIDPYQGQGIGTLLMRHLLAMASVAGLSQLTAEVLSDNTAMLGVFKRFGFTSEMRDDPQLRHLELRLVAS
jgi:RimJ/RimL family protein N-acetyltransferase